MNRFITMYGGGLGISVDQLFGQMTPIYVGYVVCRGCQCGVLLVFDERLFGPPGLDVRCDVCRTVHLGVFVRIT